MTLTFANSGTGDSSITLDAVAEMALDLGFQKEGSQALAKKPSQRADLQRFFQTYGVKAFTPFKEKFAREKLLPPEEHLEQLKKAEELKAQQVVYPSVTEEEYNTLVKESEAVEKKWRLFRKPGGVATRSPLYYDISGARKQVETGDVAVECPQWNEVGAVDYVGKALWEGHNQWKGKTTAEARAVFCKLFNDAKAERSKHFF